MIIYFSNMIIYFSSVEHEHLFLVLNMYLNFHSIISIYKTLNYYSIE
jgi:hypothetical protein